MTSNWLLYSHDALGLGHVRRMLAIAGSALAGRPDLSALLLTCSPQVDALPLPPGLDYIKLPSARKLTAHQYVPRTLRVDPARLTELRAALIADTARHYRPNLVLVDKSPLGLMGELAPALEELRSPGAAAPRLVLGWRDILDAPARIRAEWKAKGTLETIERWYDELWIYGDPEVFDARIEYALPARIAERTRFTGYLAPRVERAAVTRARAQMQDEPFALVTAGGGEDGDALLTTWVEAVRSGVAPRHLRTLLVTGPFLSADAFDRLRASAPPSVTVVPFVSQLEAFVAAADLVVGMAGYNTVCEILGAGRPAVLIPRASQRDEQRLRASRLAARGVVETVEPEQLSARAVAEAAARALERGPRPVEAAAPGELALAGLQQVVRSVDRLLPVAPPVRGPEFVGSRAIA